MGSIKHEVRPQRANQRALNLFVKGRNWAVGPTPGELDGMG